MLEIKNTKVYDLKESIIACRNAMRLDMPEYTDEEFEKAKTFSQERRIQFTAGRFAAKEAIIKCLSDHEVPNMTDLNIVNDEKGKPEIFYKDYRIFVSIAHERKYASAVAILEEEGEKTC